MQRTFNRVLSRDVMATMLVYLNKGMAAVMVYQNNSPGIELLFLCKQFLLFQ